VIFLVRLLAIAISIAVALLIYVALVRPWFLTWGASPQEVAAADSTDRLVAPSTEVGATRAMTIRASAPAVWAWVAQVGQGRGGFYSYDILEDALFRCEIHSADRIVPRFQNPQTGDEFRYCLNGPAASRSHLYVERGRAIAYSPGYAMVVEPIRPTETRLIARGRGPRGPHLGRIADFFAWDVAYDTVHFVMERKMLEGIKRRAEGAPIQSPLADDVQVLLWTIAFAIAVTSTIGVFFGKRFWPQLMIAWAAVVVWMFLMLDQPSIAVGIPIVAALVFVALAFSNLSHKRADLLKESS